MNEHTPPPQHPTFWGTKDSDNPFNLKAQVVSEVRTLGVMGQSLTRAGMGISKILGFFSFGLLATEGIVAVAGGTFGAASSGLLGGLVSSMPLISAVPPVAIVGGILIAGFLTHKALQAADNKLSNLTHVPKAKGNFLNPIAGFGNTVESVGLVGKAVSRFFKTKGNLAVLLAAGLAITEIAGISLGLASFGAATGATLSWMAGLGVFGAATAAAMPALVALGAIGIIGYAVARSGSGVDKLFDKMLQRNSGTPTVAPTPA